MSGIPTSLKIDQVAVGVSRSLSGLARQKDSTSRLSTLASGYSAKTLVANENVKTVNASPRSTLQYMLTMRSVEAQNKCPSPAIPASPWKKNPKKIGQDVLRPPVQPLFDCLSGPFQSLT